LFSLLFLFYNNNHSFFVAAVCLLTIFVAFIFSDGKVKPRGWKREDCFSYGISQISTQTTTNPNHVGKQNPTMCDM
jgi:hypothetical protein